MPITPALGTVLPLSSMTQACRSLKVLTSGYGYNPQSGGTLAPGQLAAGLERVNSLGVEWTQAQMGPAPGAGPATEASDRLAAQA